LGDEEGQVAGPTHADEDVLGGGADEGVGGEDA